ncbi:MAG: homoserine O-succinyltransferase MetA [Terriglobales bacterium]
MPVVVGGNGAEFGHRKLSGPSSKITGDCDGDITIALINNMPDAALEDTESQFLALLRSAAPNTQIDLRLYSLPGIPRSDRGQKRLAESYLGIDDLLNRRFDGVIITGTEPCQQNLRLEPYWPILVNVLDWAENNTTSTILSCLAAHAGVLRSDGIERQRLSDKQFGVFEYQKGSDHELTKGLSTSVRFPHSRWNGVPEDALTACGYSILTRSDEAGVDSFIKQKGSSLFVHFQGHPEYEAGTLLKEYKRDIRRFLRGERPTYPTMPYGSFNSSTAERLRNFQEMAVSRGGDEVFADFPDAAVADTLSNSWASSANCIYRNWIELLRDGKADSKVMPANLNSGSREP